MVVEIFTFRLAPDAAEADFLAADAAVQTAFYYGRPGIVRRTTARSSDGEWTVVVFWGTESDALAAAAAASTHEATARFGSLIDHGTIRVRTYETLD